MVLHNLDTTRLCVSTIYALNIVLDAECSLLTKLRQQHMLNEKQDLSNTYLLMTKMQLKFIDD